MTYSRRDLTMLMGALAASAAGAAAQDAPKEAAKAPAAPLTVLPSKVFPFDEIPARATGPNGVNKSRAVMHGTTHGGFSVEVHITELAPGLMPHPPHHHVHEEIIMLREGTVEVTCNGKTTKMGPGSVSYNASNEEHSLKNIGTIPAIYFVVELRATT
jgi:quercetin dioxygenase-like cupin family protein